MRKKVKYIAPERYVVINQDGEVFIGLRGGRFQYSSD